ncbi:MAG: ferredoxin [Myxococcota bacterium]
MKICVDLDRCVGHGRCYELAPDLFGEDERGHCRILREGVPTELWDLARRAVANCPERALAVIERPTGVSRRSES